MAKDSYALCRICGGAVVEKPGTTEATHMAYGDLSHPPMGTCIDCGRSTRLLAAGAWLCRGHTITVVSG